MSEPTEDQDLHALTAATNDEADELAAGRHLRQVARDLIAIENETIRLRKAVPEAEKALAAAQETYRQAMQAFLDAGE